METITTRYREYLTVKSKYLSLSANATYIKTPKGETFCLVRDIKNKNKTKELRPITEFDFVITYGYNGKEAIIVNVELPHLVKLINEGIVDYYELPNITKTLKSMKKNLDIKGNYSK